MSARHLLTRWALPVSLALNVFLGTVLVMREPRGHFDRPPGPPPSPLGMVERMADVLSPADAAILRAAAAKRAQNVEYQWRIWTSLPERVMTEMAAPRFDAERLRGALDEARKAHAEVDEDVAGVIMEAAPAMSAEGRHAIARWRPPHPRGGPGGGPPPPPPS